MNEQSSAPNGTIAQREQPCKPLRCLTCGHVSQPGDEVGEYYYHGLGKPADPYCRSIDACEARRRAARRVAS